MRRYAVTALLLLLPGCLGLPTVNQPRQELAAPTQRHGTMWLWFPYRTMTESLLVQDIGKPSMLVMLPRDRLAVDSICRCNPDDSSYFQVQRLDRVGIDTLPSWLDASGFHALLQGDTLRFVGGPVYAEGLYPMPWKGSLTFETAQGTYAGGWYVVP